MSNIAGKTYAMNVVTPIRWYTAWVNKFIFWLAGTRIFRPKLRGLITLSLIHYARWAIVKGSEFPRLDPSQPKEELGYTYELFFSNFNGSWAQYVDSFSSAIPHGLDLLWKWNVKYPKSVPMMPFHSYITYNQIPTNHYYSAYPMAASNDVKSGAKVKDELSRFIAATEGVGADEFARKFDLLLLELQHELSQMGPTPIVSLANQAVAERERLLTPAAGSVEVA